MIEQLGYLQIDTISVVARTHHHVCWSRVRNYKRDHLRRLERENKVFEYWAHAASYLPIKDFKYSLYPKYKIQQGPGHWRPREQKWIDFVLDRIEAEGALQSKDFVKDMSIKYDHPWGGHPVTQALRQLFMEGRLMIAGRKGFQKVYDLTERVLPDQDLNEVPTEREYHKYLIQRDLSSNGIMKPTEIGHLISIPPKKLKILLSEMMEEGVLQQVRINKIDGTYFCLADVLDNFENTRRRKRMYLLSPFDNLIIQRKRMSELFKFDYVLECYVPKAKRVFGYFGLPILYGREFVGLIDAKADRKRGQLKIIKLHWLPGVKNIPELKFELGNLLKSYADFNDCNQIIY